MSRLSGALTVTVAFLVVLSGFYALRAETARVQYACTGQALYELRRGRPERAVAYLRAAHVAYFTGRCEAAVGLVVEVGG